MGYLRLNGLRGGFATGAPTEVPLPYRNLFESDGFRLTVGITLSIIRASLCQLTGDMWIDVYNGNFAVMGGAKIFDGVVNATAGFGMSFTKHVFIMNTTFDMIKMVFGSSDLYIFDYQGRVLITGRAEVRVCLIKGSVVDTTILGIHILLPWADLWIASGGAEFGTFQNGMEGVRAYVKVLSIIACDVMVTTEPKFYLSAPNTHIIVPAGY